MGLHIGYKCKCQQNLESRERSKYSVSSLAHYEDFLRTVFQHESVVVYELSTSKVP